MNEQITASTKELMDQAPQTAITYYQQIAVALDEINGKNWSKEHPEIVAKMCEVAAIDFSTSMLCKTLQTIKIIPDIITE